MSDGLKQEREPLARPVLPKAPRNVSWRAIETALVLLFFYLFVWLAVDPRLVHHSLGLTMHYSSAAFSDEWSFFWEHLARPAGLVEYLSALLSQCFRFDWAGALILTLAAWCFCRLTDLLVRQAGHPWPIAARYIPAVIVIWMYGQYFHPIELILSLLVGVSFFAVYLAWSSTEVRSGCCIGGLQPRQGSSGGEAGIRSKTPWGSKRQRVLRLLVLMAVIIAAYQLAGPCALVLAMLAAVWELWARRCWLIATLSLLFGLGSPWLVGSPVFGLPPEEAFRQLRFVGPGLGRPVAPFGLGLMLFFPAVFAGTMLVTAISSWRGRMKSGGGRGTLVWRFLVKGRLARAARRLAVLSGIALIARLSLDTGVRAVLEMDRYSQQEQWARVLATAEQMRSMQFSVRCNRNIAMALYHTGRLGDEMFRYPQVLGKSVFSDPDDDRDYGTLFQESRLYLYLGQVNYAEKCAHDALGVAGDVPAVLKHLALISVVQGRSEAARVLLRALGKNPFYRHEANELLRRIDADPRLRNDSRVRVVSSLAPDEDSFDGTINVERVLCGLLNKNGRNKAAFEFLMAHYLATGQSAKVADHVGRLKGLGYTGMPRCYQEALLISKRFEAADRCGPQFAIQPSVIGELKQIGAILQSGGDPQAVSQSALAAGLGDSYFYFLLFGKSGRRPYEP